jgi:diguanylate cyclase (GGDEF)-like protein
MAQLFAEVESTRTELLAEVAERKLTQARLEDLVRRDPLTGLLNRRGFFEAWANGAGGAETALVTVDLDRFKAINDAYGHAAGDRVLRAAALKLMELLGGDSCVARIGGDEFAIMMPASADRLAWLRSELNSLHVEVADGITARISASVGVAHSSDQMSVDEVLALADAGMYSEKRARAADDLLRVDLDSLRPS